MCQDKSTTCGRQTRTIPKLAGSWGPFRRLWRELVPRTFLTLVRISYVVATVKQEFIIDANSAVLYRPQRNYYSHVFNLRPALCFITVVTVVNSIDELFSWGQFWSTQEGVYAKLMFWSDTRAFQQRSAWSPGALSRYFIFSRVVCAQKCRSGGNHTKRQLCFNLSNTEWLGHAEHTVDLTIQRTLMPRRDVLGALFCPLSSFPSLVARNEIPCLRDSCVFDTEVKPGWICYDPYKVTVLSRNEMFRPIYERPAIYSTEEQTIKVKSMQECGQLEKLFEKPIILVVSRRQEDETLVLGFDTDFVVLLDPSNVGVAVEFRKIINYVTGKIECGRKFFLTYDLSEVLEGLTPPHFKGHVMWLNTCFHVTNSRPPHPLLYLDAAWLVTCPMFPLASLLYRLWRKISCEDLMIEPSVRLDVEFYEDVPLILHFYQARHPLPGKYEQYEKHYRTCLRSTSELWCLIRLRESTA